MPTKRRPDSICECLDSVEDEEARDRRVETVFGKVVEQCLRGGRLLRGPLDQAENVLLSVAADADGADQHDILGNIQTVNLDDKRV